MRIPSKFTIKGKLWVTKYKWRLTDDDGTIIDGLMDHTTKTIYLSHGLKDEKEQVFMHEFIHAVLYEYGFHVSTITEDVEELLCENLATELLGKFRLRWKKIV